MPEQASSEDLVVVGSRDRYKMNLRVLRAGQTAFERYRAQFAPDATLSFLIEPGRVPIDRKPVKLYLTDGARKITIDVKPDDSFVLPTLPSGNWWLEANQTARQITIGPLVLSPAATRLDYRLGDARLYCRVYWAMAKASASILAAPLIGMVEAAGPCTSRKVPFYVTAPGAIRTAMLEEAPRIQPITVSKRSRRAYVLPVADKSFSNEAHIRLAID